ncbi:MAG: nucleoside-diphosphate kinase [Candidatus Kerfeldbacteria bacterium]|nr:nucleoside-diphosphate kinase [Candidatus Kerfeldbacteria bacterium]
MARPSAFDRLHPKQERTLVLVKPDGVKRGLVGEAIRRFEQRGLKLIALKMVAPGQPYFHDHYPKEQAWIFRLGEKTLSAFQKYGLDAKKMLGTDDPKKIGPKVRDWILEYMTSGPVVAIVIEGIHAIDMVRKITGPTLPNMAEMGSFRGDFSVDSPTLANLDKRAIHNLIHASENAAEARHEIKHWFTKAELHDYKRAEEDVMF